MCKICNIFIFLTIVIVMASLSFFISSRDYWIRISFYGDKVVKKNYDAMKVRQIEFNTQNCIVYLLEKEDPKNIELTISAERNAKLNQILEGNKLSVSVKAETGGARCYVMAKIPGGQVLDKVSFTFAKDKTKDVMVYDHKDGSKWKTPLDIKEFSVSVDDSSPKFFIENGHKVHHLFIQGDYCICNFHKMIIYNMDFKVAFGSLSIIQGQSISQNKITVQTPHGTHCIASKTINTVDSNCPDQKQRDIGITTKIIDTSKYCKSELYMCSDLAEECPQAKEIPEAWQGNFDITLNDGPVQILIDGSTIENSVSYNPTLDTFAVSSQNQLRTNKEEFSKEDKDPKIFIYELVSPGYSQTWLHSFLKQYLQARPWVISLVSLNFLSPEYSYNTLIHIPGRECPNPPVLPILSRVQISDKLKELSFRQAKDSFVEVSDNNYHEYFMNAENKPKKETVSFIDGNLLLVLCFCTMVIAAVIMVVAILFIAIKLMAGYEKRYNKDLQRAKRFSEAKRENRNHESVYYYQAEKKLREMKKKTKYLRLGIVSSAIVEVDQEDIEGDESLSKRITTSKLIHLSFFKTVSLVLDYLERRNTNSLKKFLSSIKVDESRFEGYEGEEIGRFEMRAIRMDSLVSKYLEYCTRFGYKALNIHENEHIFTSKGYLVEKIQNSSTSAFTHIRWKTYYEKCKHQKLKRRGLSNSEYKVKSDSIILRFLYSECVRSDNDSDFILQRDLEQKYLMYCEENEIQEIDRANISNSKKLKEFGAIYKEKFPVEYVLGIAETYSVSLDYEKSVPGLVRKTAGERNRGWLAFLRYDAEGRLHPFWQFWKTLFWNIFSSLIYFVLIFGIPLLYLLTITCFLQEINFIQEDINAPVFRLSDIFNASSFDFWFSHLPHKWLFFLLLGLAICSIMSGLVELILFFLTDTPNTGKYPTLLTWERKVVNGVFWSFLMIYLVLYLTYFSIILLWCILGSILSPAKFLPISTGAAVLAACIYYFYATITDVDKNLKDTIGKIVDEQLRNTVIKNIRENSRMKGILEQVENLPQITFNKAFNVFMELNDYPIVNRDLTDEILNGNGGVLVQVLNTNMGIDENVSLALVGIVMNDTSLILECVNSLSIQLNLDPTFNMIFTEIILESYQPNERDTKAISNSVILSTKRCCNQFFPGFQTEVIDDVLRVVYDKKIDPLKELAVKFGVPTDILEIGIHLIKRDKFTAQHYLNDFSESILPKESNNLFVLLKRFCSKDVFGKNKKLGTLLNLEFDVAIDLIFAMCVKGRDSGRYSLLKATSTLCKDSKHAALSRAEKALKDRYVALGVATSGDRVDVEKLAKNSIFDVYHPSLISLVKASLGDRFSLNQILHNLNLEEHSRIVTEMAEMVFDEKIEFTDISSRLNVPQEESNSIFYSDLSCRLPLCFRKLKDVQILKVRKDSNPNKASPCAGSKLLSFTNDKIESKNCFDELVKHDLIADKSLFKNVRGNNLDDLFNLVELEYRSCLKNGIQDINKQTFKEISKDLNTLTNLVTDNVFTTLKFKSSQRNCLEALLNLLMSVIYKSEKENLSYEQREIYEHSIKIVSNMLEIRAEIVEFIIDLFSGEPYRIFGFPCPKPKIDIPSFGSKLPMDKSRVYILSDALRLTFNQVRKIGGIWTYSQSAIRDVVKRTNDHEPSETETLCEILGVDPRFFEILTEYCTNKEEEISHTSTKKDISEFTVTCFTQLWEEVESSHEESKDGQDDPWGLPSKKAIFCNNFVDEIHNNSELTPEHKDVITRTFETSFDGHEGMVKTAAVKGDRKQLLKIFKILVDLVYKKKLGSVLKVDDDEYKLLRNANELLEEKHKDCLLAFIMIGKYLKKSKGMRNERNLIKLIHLPALILFNGVCLTSSLKALPPDSPALKDFIEVLQTLVTSPGKLNKLYNEIGYLLPCLLEVGFFDFLFSELLINKDRFSQNQINFGTRKLMSIMIAFSIHDQDSELLKTNVVSLSNAKSRTTMKALLSVVDKNPSDEESLKGFFKIIGIDHKLAYNLLKLSTLDPRIDSYKGCYNILENHCSNPSLVSAFVSLFKKDVSNLAIIANTLGIDLQNSLLVMSLAVKNTKIPWGKLAQRLGIKNSHALEIIARIACGDIKVLEGIMLRNKDTLTEAKYSLLEAMMTCQEEKVKKWMSHETINFRRIYKSCDIISDQFCENLGIEEQKFVMPRVLERVDRIEANDSRAKLIHAKTFTSKSSRNKDELMHRLLENDSLKEEDKDDSYVEEIEMSDLDLQSRDGFEQDKGSSKELRFKVPKMDQGKKSASTSIKEVCTQLILFSIGDLDATNSVFSKLKELYKKRGKQIPYTINELLRFPYMMFKICDKTSFTYECWRLGAEGKVIKKVRDVKDPDVLRAHQYFTASRANRYEKEIFPRENEDSTLLTLSEVWQTHFEDYKESSLNDMVGLMSEVHEDFSKSANKDIFCTFKVTKFYEMNQQYYECHMSDKSTVNLCLGCINFCQFDSLCKSTQKEESKERNISGGLKFIKVIPKKRETICECGHNRELTEKINGCTLENFERKFDNKLNQCCLGDLELQKRRRKFNIEGRFKSKGERNYSFNTEVIPAPAVIGPDPREMPPNKVEVFKIAEEDVGEIDDAQQEAREEAKEESKQRSSQLEEEREERITFNTKEDMGSFGTESYQESESSGDFDEDSIDEGVLFQASENMQRLDHSDLGSVMSDSKLPGSKRLVKLGEIPADRSFDGSHYGASNDEESSESSVRNGGGEVLIQDHKMIVGESLETGDQPIGSPGNNAMTSPIIEGDQTQQPSIPALRNKKLWYKFQNNRNYVNVLDLFVEDLIEAYPITGVSPSKMMMFDEHLGKVVHLYELLCQGYISPAYLRFLTVKRRGDGLLYNLYNKSNPGDDKFFGFVSTCFSLLFGEFGQFIKYSDCFLDEIGMLDSKDLDAKRTAVKIMMLLHDPSYFTKCFLLKGMGDIYNGTFSSLFGEKADVAQFLHAVVASQPGALLERVKVYDLADSQNEFGKGIISRKEQFKSFLFEKCNFDDDCYDWLKTLLCLVLGNTDRINFIAREYEITTPLMGILKALCSRRVTEMDQLFKAIGQEPGIGLTEQMCMLSANLVKGELGRSLYLQEHKREEFEEALSNCEGFEESHQKYTDLFNFIISDGFKSVKEYRNTMAGRGIENPPWVASDIATKYEIRQLDSMLRVIEGTCSDQDIREIFNSSKDTDIEVHDSYLEPIHNFIGALNGKILNFGYTCDVLFYENKTWLCSLLTSISARNRLFCVREEHLEINSDAEMTMEAAEKEKTECLKAILKIHLRAIFFSCINLDPTKDKADLQLLRKDHLINTFAYILGNSLFMGNQGLQSLMQVRDEVFNHKIIEKESFNALEELIEDKGFKHLEALMGSIEENLVKDTKDTKIKWLKGKDLYIENLKPVTKFTEAFEKATKKKLSDQTDEHLKKICGDTDKKKAAEYKALQATYGYEIFKQSKIKIKLSSMIELLLKISKNDLKSLRDLMMFTLPLFSKIHRGIEILQFCMLVIEERLPRVSQKAQTDKKQTSALVKKLPELIEIFREAVIHKSLISKPAAKKPAPKKKVVPSKKGDPKKKVDPKKVDPKKVDPKKVDPKKVDPKQKNVVVKKDKLKTLASALGASKAAKSPSKPAPKAPPTPAPKGPSKPAPKAPAKPAKPPAKKPVVKKEDPQVKIDKSMMKAVASLISLFMYIFDTRDSNPDVPEYMAKFRLTLIDVNAALKLAGKPQIDEGRQTNLLTFIVGVCKEDYKMLINLACDLGMFEDKKIKNFINIFKKFQTIIYGKQVYGIPQLSQDLTRMHHAVKKSFKEQNYSLRGAVKMIASEGAEEAKVRKENVKKDVSKRAKQAGNFVISSVGNQMTDLVYKDLFTMFDRDGSGVISYGEFKDLCRYMGLQMNEERSLKLFAQADYSGNNYIDSEEFGKAMVLIKLELAQNSLRELGLTTDDLITFGILAIAYLVVGLAFIFLGIFAFSRADSFSAVINSVFPIAAGASSVSQSSSIYDRVKMVEAHIAESFKDMDKKKKK
ncbi:unnamed protein product [Moneuplotes crassus]|uniref:EF-hand domain-containing protein n=1 Tax=Euplotes crassus TaxID=5936 RepID=A0AAD1U912_EUPCR|nr:unnamed protein product [Moneuplotes crassus]